MPPLDGQEFEVDPSFDADAPIGGDEKTIPELEGIEDDSPAPEQKADAPWDWKPHLTREVEYPAAGKTVKETLEMALKRASQGYDYAQKMGEFNTKEKGYSEKISSLEQNLKQLEYLKQIDDFARSNPQWKEHLDRAWSQRDAYQQGVTDMNDPIVQYVNQKLEKLMEPINNLSSKVTQFDKFVTDQRIKAEDSDLDVEVQSIRKEYPNLGWDTRDEFGKTLEMQVLEHAQKLGLGSGKGAFRLAFRDFNHERLIKDAEARAKEKVADQAHKLKQTGFIGKTSTPQTSTMRSKSLREKSYDDLEREALDELGIN
jgi:hypothetical protein